MDVAPLIHAIVRQTMVLVAQLATTSGIRSPLAQLANQVFLDLVQELEAQGLGRKIIADMFGMALRSYHAKVRRLSGSATDRGRSLWEAVFSYIQERDVVTRNEVLQRFDQDDVMTLRGVLNDLTESGLVFRTGRGDQTAYRVAHNDEIGALDGSDSAERVANVIWVAIYRLQPATAADVAEATGIDEHLLEAALGRLQEEGRVQRQDEQGLRATYTCSSCVIPYGAVNGWEAAIFDHFQAMVTALTSKLRRGANQARYADAVGGSTYSFDLWKGHPLEHEALALLRRVRDQASGLRRRIETHNQVHQPGGPALRVSFYFGQSVVDEQDADDGSSEKANQDA